MTARIDRREFLAATGATVALAAASPGTLEASDPSLRVTSLRADYLDRPLGLENRRPWLSWQLESSERGVVQRAYRVLVASTEAMLTRGRGDLWDSGKVESRKSFGIPYEGRELGSRQRCFWSVQVWAGQEKLPYVSPASWWEMGLLEPKDWSAQWLAVEDAAMRADRESGLQWIWGPMKNEASTRWFRRRFALSHACGSADIFAVVNDAITTATVKSIWIDGAAVEGDARLTPGRSVANTAVSLSGQRLVLPPMNAGEHVLAIEVDAGELPPLMTQAFACQARFRMADGAMLRVGSDPHWKTRRALQEAQRWYTPGFDDTEWPAAQPVAVDFHPLPPSPALNLRKVFTVDRPPVAARLYATALGAYEARLNGRRIGDAFLTPEISQYAKRALYRVYEVADLLQTGENVLGLTVGDGWYASWDGLFPWGPPPRRVLAQLELSFPDGSRQIVETGPGWRCAMSAIQSSQVRVGEVYDARLEDSGWDRVGFDDSHWQHAELAEVPPCELTAQVSPPVRAVRTLKPVTFSQRGAAETYLFDFGQSFSGWCRLRVQGKAGQRIELEFADTLDATGALEQGLAAIGELKRDVYILRGATDVETFEPHFTYRGFRYVQVTGLAATPTLDTLEGVVAHSDLPVTGRLRMDVPLIEQIWRNTVWTQRSNLVCNPTDCPHREQRGWMGDAGVFWSTAAFNMDVHGFSVRYLQNVRDDQHADGQFSVAAPEPRLANSVFIPGAGSVWGDAGIILPWTVWQRYGDLAVIEQNWEAMNRYLESILERNPNYLSRNRTWEIGDHLAPEGLPRTPVDLVSTAYWAYSASLLSQMAQATGRTGDAGRLQTLFDRVRRAFNQEFVKADGTVGIGTQTGYILALHFGLLPESLRRPAAERLANDIRQRGTSLTTGIVGTQFSLDVLAEAGFDDLIYGLLLRTASPSWGYMIRHGATTIWEHWTGQFMYEGELRTFSLNQYAFGSVGSFLFRRVAGIDAGTPGFENIVIRPLLDSRVKKAGGDYDSIMGRISTDWEQRADGSFELRVVVPANARARVHLPVHRSSRLYESGRPLLSQKDARLAARNESEATVDVGSGSYHFTVVG